MWKCVYLSIGALLPKRRLYLYLHPIEMKIRDINRVFVWHRISKINPDHPGRIRECVPSGMWCIIVPYVSVDEEALLL